MKNIEILAPAGSKECLEAAVGAGADAVYLGGARFGARAFAENFGEEELLFAIDYAHIHGKKLYLTVNTLVKDGELSLLYRFLAPLYREGLDAVIVQDLGAMDLIREEFPDLPIHVSTQATVTGRYGAAFFRERGAERIVPARELSLREVRRMKQETGLQIECFVHGALCYCYSGQCLLSSMIGGRSGNRGQCAQPCRLSCDAGDGKRQDMLSLKDLCTIDMIPELAGAGIDSFKIEGRMKQPDYVYTVVRMYRKYTDIYLSGEGTGFSVSERDREILLGSYRRRGYTKGYYYRHNGKDMVSLRRPKETAEGSAFVPCDKMQEKINGKLILSEGERAKLYIRTQDVKIVCEGDKVQRAKNQPLERPAIQNLCLTAWISRQRERYSFPCSPLMSCEGPGSISLSRRFCQRFAGSLGKARRKALAVLAQHPACRNMAREPVQRQKPWLSGDRPSCPRLAKRLMQAVAGQIRAKRKIKRRSCPCSYHRSITLRLCSGIGVSTRCMWTGSLGLPRRSKEGARDRG